MGCFNAFLWLLEFVILVLFIIALTCALFGLIAFL